MPEAVAREHLRRLLAPRSLVVVGGRAAEVAAGQSRAIGYPGRMWAVHPTRPSVAGLPCLRSVAELPEAPDAAFVAVSRERTVEVVAQLAARGTGGVVCHASGFAEDGAYGAALQRDLVAAAGDMALIGPNCLGLVNYLDGAALWSEQHGGARVDRGVAVVAQSGNIAENLTMQRRSLPIAQLVTIGNGAVTGVTELVEGMLDDPRITAVGLYLEAVPDVVELSRVALTALRRRVPMVVLKAGASDLGASVTLSHTNSLAGSDVLADALFERLGIARVHDLGEFVETLKLLHVHGALPGARVTSASCSGGEAALVADLAARRGVRLPAFAEPTSAQLHSLLGDRVTVGNPLDYHTYVWGDRDAMTSCFTAVLGAEADAHLLLLDLPRTDRCDVSEFESTLAAFETAQQRTGAVACVVSSLPEGMPEATGARLLGAGIAPMQGLDDALVAVAGAAAIGAAQARVDSIAALAPVSTRAGETLQLDEPAAKRALAAFGLVVPRGRVTTADRAPAEAASLGFPVVVKAVSSTRAHKSDVGGVIVGLTGTDEVSHAVAGMRGLGEHFLVELMASGAVLELIVGVRHDPHFGPALTIGVGGVLVDLLQDATTLLLPASRSDVRTALRSLRCWPLLRGYRGRPADVESVLDAVEAVLGYAAEHADALVELEVNPLLVLTRGTMAVDALVRLRVPAAAESVSA